jgi:hypothetical protein
VAAHTVHRKPSVSKGATWPSCSVLGPRKLKSTAATVALGFGNAAGALLDAQDGREYTQLGMERTIRIVK